MSVEMAELTQYTFGLKEVVVALLKEQGVDSGLWDLAIDLQLAAGLMGPTPETAYPSALVQIMKLSLMKHPEDQPFGPTTVDAATINSTPASKQSGPKLKKK